MPTAEAAPITVALTPFVEAVMATSGASKATVIRMLGEMADHVGKIVRACLDAQRKQPPSMTVATSRPATRKETMPASHVIQAHRDHGGASIMLSRIKSGAKTTSDLSDVDRVSADVVNSLGPHEHRMFAALTQHQRLKAGRALAITLASFRDGCELPETDPMAASIKASREQYARNRAMARR